MKITWSTDLSLKFVCACILVVMNSCNKKQPSEVQGNFSELSLDYYRTGNAYQFQNEDSSFYYFDKSLKIIFLNKNDTLRPFVLFRIAMLHFRAFNYKEALKLYDSAMGEAKRNKNYIVVSNCLNELGAIEQDLNNPDQARSYFQQSLQLAEKFKLSHQIGVILGNLANLETNPDTALKLMNRALENIKNIKGAEMEYCTILANIANSSSQKDTAIKFFHEAITIAEKGNYSEVLIGAYNNLSCIYLENNQTKEAEECLRDHAIPLALKSENADWLSTAYESYSEVLEKKGDFHQAYFFQKKSMKTRIEASQQLAGSQMRLLNALFRAKNREIEIKKKEDEIKAKHDQLNRLYIWLFFLGMAIILIVIIFLWWIQRKKLKLKIQEINTAKRLSAIEEKEHERLSMQLHDTIRPLTSVLLKQIESMEFPDKEMKKSMIGKLTEATRQMRQISHRLNPLIREQMTFTELTRSLRDDFQGRSGLVVKLQLPDKDPDIPKDSINQLYFILQELMMNAGKHVITGNVSIIISEEFDNFYILYEDDGKGFNRADVQLSGLGLMHIFERANLLNGKAVLDSSPGKGTRWTISIPLNKIK